MATQNDLMSVIKTLVGTIEKITESFKGIESIAEDFKSLTADVKCIAECMRDRKESVSGAKDSVSNDKLASRSEVTDLENELIRKLEPVSKIPALEEKLSSIEDKIFNLRSIDSETNAEISERVKNTEGKLVSIEETMNKMMLSMENATQNRDELPTKSDLSAIREMLDEKLNPLYQIRTMDERMLKIEESISHLRRIDSETNAEISDRVKNTERKLVSMEETMNKLMLSMENATQNRRIDSETNAEISDRVKITERKLVSMEETMNKLMPSMENATQNRSIDSETNADISDRVKNTESKLVSMEETINKLMLTKDNATRNGKVEENSNYAFDAIFKGKKIKLSNDQRTASRLRPLEDCGYGGVLSNIPLRDDVAFEVRIDETIDEWRNFGIALGVVVEKDEAVKEKEYICHDVPGTYCIRSYSDADEGKSNILKDGIRIRKNAYNLDTRHLPVGTTLGVIRRSNNALHFLFNGVDKGVAFSNVPEGVYAFLDVADYVSKITIIS